jgi:hypothetical protein
MLVMPLFIRSHAPLSRVLNSVGLIFLGIRGWWGFYYDF